MQLLPTGPDKYALVDDSDYRDLSQRNWYTTAEGYAARMEVLPGGRRRTVLMHRYLLDTPEGLSTDHINGNKLDNRRSNLRVATHADNQHNRAKYANNTSGFKGVSWHSSAQKWRARITLYGKQVFLGHFASREAAAKAYDLAAKRLHGPFARLNLA